MRSRAAVWTALSYALRTPVPYALLLVSVDDAYAVNEDGTPESWVVVQAKVIGLAQTTVTDAAVWAFSAALTLLATCLARHNHRLEQASKGMTLWQIKSTEFASL